MTRAPRGSAGAGRRSPSVRVRSARGRKPSSTRWLQRQLNDPYVAEARRSGLRSRAAFKLAEIDDRMHLLRPGQRAVDLGAAPGGWSQLAAQRVKAGKGPGAGRVIAADILPMEPIENVETVELDMRDPDAPDRLRTLLGGPADVVLSDMAAPTTGHRATDHVRTLALAEIALDFACRVLAENGTFVAKMFQGGAQAELLDRVKRAFSRVKHVKPPASRDESPEIYLVATGFRGGSGRAD